MNSEVLIKFKGDTSDVDSNVKGLESSLDNLTKSITLGNIAAKGITKGIEIFSQNLDGAISRVDTMNNFSTVMKNLGISAQDSEEVIKSLSEKLQGLPTTLNSAASSVQRLTAYNGDIKKSEKYFLAMNNAILAGTNDAQMQASAMEQLTQAYTKGKPEMQDWKTLLQAMPAQLKQVALAMGYVQTEDLYDALQKGKVSMNDFMDTIVKLNDTGVGEFASLEDQARANTNGISTSVQNMKTAFVRGIGDMVTKINESLSDFGGLSGVFTSIGKAGESAFKVIGNVLSFVIPKIISVINWIEKNKIAIEILVTTLGGLYLVFKTLTIINTIKNAVIAFRLAITMLKTQALLCNTTMSTFKITLGLLNLSFLASPIFWIIAGIVALVSAFVILWNKCEGFRNFWISLWEGIKNVFSIILNGIINFLTQLPGKIYNILTTIVDSVKQWFEGMINFVINKTSEIVNGIINFLTQLPGNIMQIFSDVLKVFSDWFANIANIFNNVKNVFQNIIEFIKNVFTGNWKAAWQNVKNIFSNIVSGLANIFKFPINTIINLINMFIKGLNKIKIPKWVPGVGGKGINIPLIPKLATGTNYVPEDMVALIHQGEAVVPKKFNPYANGIDSSRISSMQNTYNPNIQVFNNVNIEQDPLGQLVHNIKTYSGGSPNDYNYGVGVS